jgi:tripartite-type tricarboxylate transporter receptor subunit TctC
MSRRSCRLIAAFLVAAPLLTTATVAGAAQSASRGTGQAYPDKPIRFVIPFPPGSFSDVVGRLTGQKLSESMGQPVVMDVRPGASGNIGAEIVARAAPDGYTLLLNSFNYVANPGAMQLPFDPIRDFTPISMVADGIPLVMVVSSTSPHKSVQDLIAFAKSRKGQLNFATSGRGTSSHLVLLMLKQVAGAEMNQVPYKGTSQALSALVAGEIAAAVPYINVAMPQIKAGRLRPLAVTGAKRTPSMPELPTMVEAGFPGLVITGFAGLLAPARTPQPIVTRLHREIVAMGAHQDYIDRLSVFDLQPVGSTPQDFSKYLAVEIAKWKKVFSDAGEKPGI